MGPFIVSKLAAVQAFRRTRTNHHLHFAAAVAATSVLFLRCQHQNHQESLSPSPTTWHYSMCEESSSKPSAGEAAAAAERVRLARKQTTLEHASGATANNRGGMLTRVAVVNAQRFTTRRLLDDIRASEKEMLLRWERDEDGWRDLPARAWPAYQPNPDQLKGIQFQVKQHGCSIETKRGTKGSPSSVPSDLCIELFFNVATALVFYNLDPEEGFQIYEALASKGHVDSMVACGIVLIEGMGVPPNEQKGIEWLEKAVELNSAQGCYELGTALYTGIDEVLEEDPEAAFELFRRAAEQDHTAGMYMMADCLLEGEGTEQNIGRAVPLFYKAAERGHRYSRQKIRELLAQYK